MVVVNDYWTVLVQERLVNEIGSLLRTLMSVRPLSYGRISFFSGLKYNQDVTRLKYVWKLILNLKELSRYKSIYLFSSAVQMSETFLLILIFGVKRETGIPGCNFSIINI